MRKTLSTSCIFITALATGCGDDAGGEDTGSSGETTAVTSTGEEPTTGEPFVPFPARGGIVITAVEANPGVAVPIGKDGGPVGGGVGEGEAQLEGVGAGLDQGVDQPER